MSYKKLAVTGLAIGLFVSGMALAGLTKVGAYEGAGVIVTNAGGNGLAATILDNGAVVCDGVPDGNGVYHGHGGACIPFGTLGMTTTIIGYDTNGDPIYGDVPNDSIYVHDDSVADDKIAFQVCIDNDGDGICGGSGGSAGDPGAGRECGDIIVFSHSTFGGANYNPLWVGGMESHWQSCGGQGFPGYIVITCAGAHINAGDNSSHAHQATTGSVSGVLTGGTPSGDFCGAPTAAKAYIVQ
jgi:hypothetical protein